MVQLLSSFSGGSIAWYAPLGGFIAGVGLLKLLWSEQATQVLRRYHYS